MKKKILYLFSDTGGGHRSAANAIVRAVEQLRPGKYEQEMVDVFASCSGFLNIFARLYAPVIKYSPKLWGRLYYWLDDERKIEMLEKIARPFIQKELTRMLKEKCPDLIVSVHPMVNHLTVKAIKLSGRKVPFVLVITDPVTLHRAWVTPGVDRAVVATEAARRSAVKYGLPAKKIKVIGMPVDPKFLKKAKDKDKEKGKRFTILMMGGGEGAGKMGEILDEMKDQRSKIKVIIVCGRNKKLEMKLRKNKHRYPFPLEIYGFTDKVPELMARSDLIITKAGPGTIAEALTMGLPIIITDWLPGQEEGNVEYVIKEKIGWVNKDPRGVAEIVRQVTADKKVVEKMKKNIKRASRPNAAIDIAKLILTYA